MDQYHRTHEKPDPSDVSVDSGEVKTTPLSSKPSVVSSTSDELEKSEVSKLEAETKKQIKRSKGSVVSVVEETETDFRKVKLKSVSKTDQTKTKVDTDQPKQIKGDKNQNVDAEITERSDGKGEEPQITVSEIPETFISSTNRKQRMTKLEGRVEEADAETKQKRKRKEIDEEKEFQRINLKTNVKRPQADSTDEGYSIKTHEPQRGVKQRITTCEKIKSESELTPEVSSEIYIADILDAKDVSVDNQSIVSDSLNQSTKSSSATRRDLSPVPVSHTKQVKLKKTDLMKRQIPQEEVEFPDLPADRFIRNDANENIEKVTLRKVAKGKTNAGIEGKEVESNTEEQASPKEAILSRESNSTAEESTKQKMEKIPKATDKIPKEKHGQHPATMQEKVEDVQKLQLGRASLLNTGRDRVEPSKVESRNEAHGALQVKAVVPRKTEDTISELSSSLTSGRTSPVQEPFRLKSVASSSPRRKEFSVELEPVPHIDQVKLRKTRLIKTKTKTEKEELEPTKLHETNLSSKGMHEASGIILGKASEKGLDISSEDNDSVEKHKDPITTVEIHRTQLSSEDEADKEPEERLKALPGGNAEQKPVKDSAPKNETQRDAEHNKFNRASERDENDAVWIRIDIPRQNEEDSISTLLKSVASSSSRTINFSPEPEPVPHIEQVKLRKTGLIRTKTKKEELEETNPQTTTLSGNERNDNTDAINSTKVLNEQTPTDSKVKDPTENGAELKSTAKLYRKKSSTGNETKKHLTEKPKTPTGETATEMHDKYPEPQKETDSKPQEMVFRRASLRKTGLDLETLKPKSQREEDDKPKPEDKKETKSRFRNTSVSEKTEPLELKSISPRPLISPEPVFMEEVKLKKTGLIKRNTEQEELKVVDSLETRSSKNEDETMNLRTVSKNRNL